MATEVLTREQVRERLHEAEADILGLGVGARGRELLTIVRDPNRIRLTSDCRPRLVMENLDKCLERRENRRNQ